MMTDLKNYIFQLLLLLVFCYFCLFTLVCGQFTYQKRDSFDDVRQKLDKVTPDNCKVVDVNDLFLSLDTISHRPDIKTLGIDPVFPNRTNLLHIHNMAMSRAFFYSYILQRSRDELEPGMMYYYLSTIADVAANKFINSSAIYFSTNMSFTPSYKGFFNKTLPLFGPRTFRADDFNDPYHLEGTSTLNTFQSDDLGAIPNDSISLNYTHDQYKINEWYRLWLPDLQQKHDTKTTYTVQISYLNGTNDTFTWHGPPAASDDQGPIKWFRPYFDCGRSNKWIFGATVPIPDFYPRHTQWRHIEYPTYVAVAVMELDFERIDINQCPITGGNPAPNMYAGTAKCKNETTECEPIHGYGFRRGGYNCRCKPSFRLPKIVRTPYLGEIIERASRKEYVEGFHCEKINYLMQYTQNVIPVEKYERQQYIDRITSRVPLGGNMSYSRRLDPNEFLNFLYREVNNNTCRKFQEENPELLTLRGDVSYGKEEQLENEARSAVRLANFISSFLQIVNPNEQFAELRVPDRELTEEQMIGEVLSMVIGNKKIQGAGVFWDRGQFSNRTFFAPYAYRKKINERTFYVDDQARHMGNDPYLKKHWFRHLKTRWSTDTDDLETYTNKISIRFNSSGLYQVPYDHYPIQYKAAEMRHGYWSSPYYDCGGYHNFWMITYSAPFFGLDKIRSHLEFKGVVTVVMRLDELNLNQCEDEYFVQNAFKDTHKCDRRSSWCMPILGRDFLSGSYKCECKQGYEYPFNDLFTYFDGQIVEAEFEKMVANLPSRFDTLKCRLAGAGNVSANLAVILLILLISLFLTK